MRLFRVARARIAHEIEDDRHGFYLRLRVRPHKVERSRFSDRPPDQKKYDGADRCGNQIAPEIRHHFQPKLFKKEATDDGAHEPTARLYNKPPRPPRIWVASQPASNPIMIQAMTPMVFSRIKVRRRIGNLYNWWRNASAPRLSVAPTNAVTKTSRRRSKTRGHVLILGVYTLAVFLSASLLFGVQPMFARMVLP